MQSLQEIKQKIVSDKDQLFRKYGFRQFAIFGSYTRLQQVGESDVDILVDFEKPVGVEFIDLAEELEKFLKLKVDLVSKKRDQIKILSIHSKRTQLCLSGIPSCLSGTFSILRIRSGNI